jgi:anaerobic ribonucleoside-triphosphate reductase activating protein
MPVRAVFETIMTYLESIEGVTITGGEPFDQPLGLMKLLGMIRKGSDLSVILFSGHTYERITQMPFSEDILCNIDTLVAGPYAHKVRAIDGLMGSANQSVHLLTNRYSISDLRETPSAEAHIDERGRVRVTGVDPPDLKSVNGPDSRD